MDPLVGRVELSLPPDSRYMRLARLMASGVASTCGLPLEEVEDFRIAVDELCSTLIEMGDGQPIRHIGVEAGREYGRNTRRNDFAAIKEIAAHVDVRFPRLIAFFQDERGPLFGQSGEPFLEPAQFSFQLTQVRGDGAVVGGDEFLLFWRASSRRRGEHGREVWRHWPPARGVVLGGHREADAADGVAVAMVMLKAEPEFG